MIFAVFDPSPLTVCINCSFLHLYMLKLLCISILIPNFSFLTQLLPEIWSPLFAIGLTLAPEMGFWVFPTRSGFFGIVLVSGYFWLNLTKSGFLRHCSFSPHSITSLLTTLNFMALKLQLWWYLFCYYFIYFAQLPHFHRGTDIQPIRND